MSRAIEAVLDQIQEEEEWRKRRKSLFGRPNAAGTPTSPTDGPLTPRSEAAVAPITSITKLRRSPPDGGDGAEWSFAADTSAIDATATAVGYASQHALVSADDADHEEALLTEQHGDPRRYEREDVQRWMEVSHAPPEAILRYAPAATPAGDVWSAAMVALELYCARPMVYGKNPRDVFFRAAMLCGCPSQVQAPDLHRWGLHVLHSQLPSSGIRSTPLQSLVPLACAEAIDLLERMLVIDPSQRVSAAEALAHPFFTRPAATATATTTIVPPPIRTASSIV